MKINIYSTDGNAIQKQIGSVSLIGDRVVPNGSSPLVTMVARRLVTERDGNRLTPRDGERFLKRLPAVYSGSRLRCEVDGAKSVKHLQGQHDQQSHGRGGAADEYIFGRVQSRREINDALRSGQPLSKGIADKVLAIDADIAENGEFVDPKLVVHRGMALQKDHSLVAAIESGESFKDLAFVSTTKDKSWAEFALTAKPGDGRINVMLNIRQGESPPKALFNPREDEYLFERNVSFDVHRVRRDGLLIEADVIVNAQKPA